LDSFTLGAAHDLKMRDTFYDTPARALITARHVLRVRRRNDAKQFVTLKAPTEKIGAVHRRPEIEVEVDFARLPNHLSRANLPPRVYKHIASLVGDAVLHPLFSIAQTRRLRVLKMGRRVIGEWSVDRVEFRAGARTQVFYELEIELKKTGTETDLKACVAALKKHIRLAPQRHGKFQRALKFYETK
jgi:inorganic triphosphatase YgiF